MLWPRTASFLSFAFYPRTPFFCVCVWRRKEKRTSILGRQGRDEYNERMMQGNSSHFEASPSPGSQPKWCPLTESFAVLTPFVQRDIRNQIYLVTVSQLLEMTTLVVLAPLPSTRASYWRQDGLWGRYRLISPSISPIACTCPTCPVDKK